MIDTSKLTPEWLAGFFDGEGSVSIRSAGSYKAGRLRVNLTQANYAVLKAIADKYSAGYGPYTKNRRTKSGKESIVYEIGWNGAACYDILKVLQPLVVIKARQVEIALEFLATFGENGVRLSVDTVSQRESMMKEMRYLNHAGPFKPAIETAGVLESNEGVNVTVH